MNRELEFEAEATGGKRVGSSDSRARGENELGIGIGT